MGTDSFTVTWHPKIPPPPDSFPEGITFQLTGEEKQFVKDCLVGNHRASLLGDLAIHPPEEGVSLERSDFPWEHSRFAKLSEKNKKLLHHARLFSEIFHGAAVLYNFLLADLAQRHELADRYRESLLEWTRNTIDASTHQSWSLDELWQLVIGHGYKVTYPTRDFVRSWLRLVNEAKNPHHLLDSREAHELIRARERRLKRSRSRFANLRALDQWGDNQDWAGSRTGGGTSRCCSRIFMLGPDQRTLYTEALRPPAGYVFDEGRAATYTLNLTTVLAVPLHLVLQSARDPRELLKDSVALLEALRRVSSRLTVYCDSGRIHAPTSPNILYSLLEPVVVEVKAPRGGAFHPKFWILRFVPGDDESENPPILRVLVLSRNLTFDRSWDICLTLEGSRLSNRFSVIFFRACREELLHLFFPAGQVQVLPAG